MEISGVFVAIVLAVLIVFNVIDRLLSLSDQTAKPDEALIISGSYLGNKMCMPTSNNKIQNRPRWGVHSYYQFSNVRIASVYYQAN